MHRALGCPVESFARWFRLPFSCVVHSEKGTITAMLILEVAIGVFLGVFILPALATILLQWLKIIPVKSVLRSFGIAIAVTAGACLALLAILEIATHY